MQAAHPLVAAGVSEHSGYREGTWDRLAGTMWAVDRIVFGSREEADRVGELVRRRHARVRGRLPAARAKFPEGTPYSALDPELLMWVHATLVDTALCLYERLARPLPDEEREAFYQDMRVLARVFGVPDGVVPPDLAAFSAYLGRMLAGGEIAVGPEARDIAAHVLEPPGPTLLRPLFRLLALMTAGLLPASLRAAYGLGWGRGRELLLLLVARLARPLLRPMVSLAWRLLVPSVPPLGASLDGAAPEDSSRSPR